MGATVEDPPPGGGGGGGAPLARLRPFKLTLVGRRLASAVVTGVGASTGEEEEPLFTVPNPAPEPEITSKGVAGVEARVP
jgi:hypothetical protein